jgi:hypothetical protein
MPNFNTQTESQIKADLFNYGYTWVETSSVASPLIMYFTETSNFDTILKLTVDATSYAYIYTYVDGKHWREQSDILASVVVTDLASLDTLLLPEYVAVDTNILDIEYLTEISNVDVLTPTVSTYYNSVIFEDSLSLQYKISVDPSPYRSITLNWVPITLVGPNWVLTYNNSVIVNTADKITTIYGDHVIVKPL